jgi:hypothetical protein
MNIRACIRQNLEIPYQEGAYGIEQITMVYRRVCNQGYAEYQQLNASVGAQDMTDLTFKLLVLQSIDPTGYKKAVDNFNARAQEAIGH